ncbi:MAG: hypothetical protein AB7L84_01040 [Acidimicrobiia bacterium]
MTAIRIPAARRTARPAWAAVVGVVTGLALVALAWLARTGTGTDVAAVVVPLTLVGTPAVGLGLWAGRSRLMVTARYRARR